MDASTLADELRRKATAVTDPSVRVCLFRALAAELPLPELREASRQIAGEAFARDPTARIALLSLHIALSSDLALWHSVHAIAFAPLPEDPAVPRCADPDVVPAVEPDAAEAKRIPNYGSGRVLTLGERKSLARRPDRKLLDRALRDPDPAVIELLLFNPRITEDDVVRLCASRPGVPEVLLQVFQCPKWSLRPRVQRSLALNPATPTAVITSLLPLLEPVDLRCLAEDARLAPVVRDTASALIGFTLSDE